MSDFAALKKTLETKFADKPFEEAIAEIGRYLKRRPGDAQALALRADYRGLLDDWSGVVEDLEAVRRVDPQGASGARLPHAYLALGRLAEAEEAYTRALELDAGDLVLFEGRAQARERRGDLAGALEDLRAVVEKSPNDHALLAKLASLEVRAGLIDQALVHLDAAIFIAAEYWPYFLDRGVLHARAERWKETERDMGRVIERTAAAEGAVAARLTAFTYRGWARLHLGRVEEALPDLDAAVRLGPQDAQARGFRAMARAARRDPRALEDFDAALSLDPDDPFLLGARGEYHLLVRGDKNAALADFEKAVALDPDAAPALEKSLRLARG